MKRNFLPGLVVLIGISTTATAASPIEIWNCQGGTIKNLSILETDGKYSAAVTWNCIPGGILCHATIENVTDRGDGLHGNTDLVGQEFELDIDDDVVRNGTSPGGVHVVAQGTKDEGGGLDLDTNVRCKSN